MHFLKVLLLLHLIFILSSCDAVIRVDTPSTLAAENRQYVTEAAQIRGTLTAQETRVMATSIAAETMVAEENMINAILLSTVLAGAPPTVQVVAQLDRGLSGIDGERDVIAPISDVPGGTVLETYTTSEVRQSDGCGVNQQTQFPEGTLTLYAVQRVQDIPAQTVIDIQWYYGGALAFEDSLVVTTADDDLCVWFFLEPYSMGDWSVQFLSNGTPVGQQVNFSVGG